MSKVKYYYDAENLAYKRIKTKKRKKIKLTYPRWYYYFSKPAISF